MTNIWIAAAVSGELDWLADRLKASPAPDRTGEELGFRIARTGSAVLRLGLTGVGLAEACFRLGVWFGAHRPDAAFMIGSAGAMPGTGLETGRTTAVQSETLAEMGLVIGPGTADASRFACLGMDQEIGFDKTLTGAIIAANNDQPPVPARSLTVVGVSADENQAGARADRFGAELENMEGYALALAAARIGCPAAEIRAISNRAGDGDKANWDFALANRRAQETLYNYLRTII